MMENSNAPPATSAAGNAPAATSAAGNAPPATSAVANEAMIATTDAVNQRHLLSYVPVWVPTLDGSQNLVDPFAYPPVLQAVSVNPIRLRDPPAPYFNPPIVPMAPTGDQTSLPLRLLSTDYQDYARMPPPTVYPQPQSVNAPSKRSQNDPPPVRIQSEAYMVGQDGPGTRSNPTDEPRSDRPNVEHQLLNSNNQDDDRRPPPDAFYSQRSWVNIDGNPLTQNPIRSVVPQDLQNRLTNHPETMPGLQNQQPHVHVETLPNQASGGEPIPSVLEELGQTYQEDEDEAPLSIPVVVNQSGEPHQPHHQTNDPSPGEVFGSRPSCSMAAGPFVSNRAPPDCQFRGMAPPSVRPPMYGGLNDQSREPLHQHLQREFPQNAEVFGNQASTSRPSCSMAAGPFVSNRAPPPIRNFVPLQPEDDVGGYGRAHAPPPTLAEIRLQEAYDYLNPHPIPDIPGDASLPPLFQLHFMPSDVQIIDNYLLPFLRNGQFIYRDGISTSVVRREYHPQVLFKYFVKHNQPHAYFLKKAALHKTTRKIDGYASSWVRHKYGFFTVSRVFGGVNQQVVISKNEFKYMHSNMPDHLMWLLQEYSVPDSEIVFCKLFLHPNKGSIHGLRTVATQLDARNRTLDQQLQRITEELARGQLGAY